MKSKLTHEQIAEINREMTNRFGKSPTSLFRCWCDDVIIKLKTSTDRVVFDAILSTEFATPDCAEWRKKHDVSMKNIEDELLVANAEITAVNKQIQPLNDIQVGWLREWFANHVDISGEVYLTIALQMIKTADTPKKCYDAISFLHLRRNHIAKCIIDNPDIVDYVKVVYKQMQITVEDCGAYSSRCNGMVEEFGRTVFPDECQTTSPTKDTSTTNISHIESLESAIDTNSLESYFNARFKGVGNNPNYFETLVSDIKKINVTKELAMIAVMIYDCNKYFIKKPSTFTSWLREFFDIIGRDCPKDTHKNKYQPSESIRKMFYYLK